MQLRDTDKKAQRIYMINHGDTILARSIDGRRREEVLFAKVYYIFITFKFVKDYRFLAQKARQSSYSNYYAFDNQYQYEVFNTNLGTGEMDEDGYSFFYYNVLYRFRRRPNKFHRRNTTSRTRRDSRFIV